MVPHDSFWSLGQKQCPTMSCVCRFWWCLFYLCWCSNVLVLVLLVLLRLRHGVWPHWDFLRRPECCATVQVSQSLSLRNDWPEFNQFCSWMPLCHWCEHNFAFEFFFNVALGLPSWRIVTWLCLACCDLNSVLEEATKCIKIRPRPTTPQNHLPPLEALGFLKGTYRVHGLAFLTSALSVEQT